MASEQFSLCWDNFHKNMSSGMQSLLESEDLVDVTLAVEGRYLKAHKMVLSVCSPYFRELFQSSPCKHPIVFMKDVSYIALSDLLQFMYQGEVQVAQENLSTFIKTAEALQIKGLTGDNGNQNDTEPAETSDIEKPVVVEPVKRTHEIIETKATPVARVRKPAGPASKRPKYTLPVAESTPVHNPTTTVTTASNIEGSSTSTAPTTEEMIQFKMEPSEAAEQPQIEAIDDSQSERYGDESAADDVQEDTEDYGLMETGDDEPKAGTSADGMGDGQDCKFQARGKGGRKKVRRMRYIVNGFVYHTSVVRTTPSIRYLICSKYGSTGCHARAILPLNATTDQLRVTRPHNHPPDNIAEDKFLFFKQLKEVTQASPNSSMKILFDGVLSMYPRLASEMSFESIRTSMRRWRKEAME